MPIKIISSGTGLIIKGPNGEEPYYPYKAGTGYMHNARDEHCIMIEDIPKDHSEQRITLQTFGYLKDGKVWELCF